MDKRKEAIPAILMILVGLLMFGGALQSIIYIESQGKHIEYVDCYDRNNNLIEGLTCDKEVYDKEWLNELGLQYFAVLTLFAGALLIFMGSLMNLIIIIQSPRESSI